jgi:hypothetical protein
MGRKIFALIFFAWVLVLSARSALYVYRIYKEFKNPPVTLAQTINPCTQNNNFESLYEERLYKYLKLGKSCKN